MVFTFRSPWLSSTTSKVRARGTRGEVWEKQCRRGKTCWCVAWSEGSRHRERKVWEVSSAGVQSVGMWVSIVGGSGDVWGVRGYDGGRIGEGDQSGSILLKIFLVNSSVCWPSHSLSF